MAAIGNGIALHGGLRPYVSTFFVFSDYVKQMARLSSLMKLPLTYVLTHDSIGVGEDGPTHEPIEQLATFRALPNFYAWRPADAMETAAAWYFALNKARTLLLPWYFQDRISLSLTVQSWMHLRADIYFQIHDKGYSGRNPHRFRFRGITCSRCKKSPSCRRYRRKSSQHAMYGSLRGSAG